MPAVYVCAFAVGLGHQDLVVELARVFGGCGQGVLKMLTDSCTRLASPALSATKTWSWLVGSETRSRILEPTRIGSPSLFEDLTALRRSSSSEEEVWKNLFLSEVTDIYKNV